MSVFVDSSAWYAGADLGDRNNAVVKRLLQTPEPLASDHVVIEAWCLVHQFISAHAANKFWGGLRRGVATIEQANRADLEAAWTIGERFPDQDFSLVDRTSFAVMERHGISRVISFDGDFAVYRYGPNLRTAFELLR